MSVDTATCTLETCSIEEYGFLHYLPSPAGNGLYLGIFAVLLIPQLFLGIRYRTWGYLVGMTGGIILEILGYVARFLLRSDIFSLNYFVFNICCLTIGPAFFSAAIYVCLSRIIYIYGEDLSPIRPQLITFMFVTCDIIALALQAAGGALTSSADDRALADIGVNIMIAGLSFQVATTFTFCVICTLLFLKIRQTPTRLNQSTISLRESRSFRLFLIAITVATIAILIRCCYRVAELSQGYNSAVANDEVLFMILEGAMMVICVLALTLGHPGPILGRHWSIGKFRFGALCGKRNSQMDGHIENGKPAMGKYNSQVSI